MATIQIDVEASEVGMSQSRLGRLKVAHFTPAVEQLPEGCSESGRSTHERFGAHVATGDGPLAVLLGEDGATPAV